MLALVILAIRAELQNGTTKTLRQVIRNEAEYPEVNPSEKILLLIDECHRSTPSGSMLI